MGTIMPDPGLSRLQLSEENKPLFPLPLPPPQPQATSALTCAAQIVVCHHCGHPRAQEVTLALVLSGVPVTLSDG